MPKKRTIRVCFTDNIQRNIRGLVSALYTTKRSLMLLKLWIQHWLKNMKCSIAVLNIFVAANCISYTQSYKVIIYESYLRVYILYQPRARTLAIDSRSRPLQTTNRMIEQPLSEKLFCAWWWVAPVFCWQWHFPTHTHCTGPKTHPIIHRS